MDTQDDVTKVVPLDGKVNGVTQKTRLIGCGYLFPQLIPDAHTATLSLHQEDQMIILANQGLWEFVSYQEAVDNVLDIPDPVVAAKRLQDLAQGYGSKENIAILVIRLLLTDDERERMKSIVRTQLEFEQNALMFLESVPLASENIYGSDVNFTDSLARKVLDGRKRVKHHSKDVPVKPLPNQRYRKKEALSEWENILQKRIVDEVKFRELVSTFSESDMDVEVGSEQKIPSNWSTLERAEKQNTDDVTIQPVAGYPTTAYPPPPPVWDESGMFDSVEDFKRNRHLYPRNIDRDAVLFYQMQQARKAQNNSTASLSSIQSDPMGPTSFKYPQMPSKSGSHSIEVLIRSPSLQGQNRHEGSRTRKITVPSTLGDDGKKYNEDFNPICSSSAKECDVKDDDVKSYNGEIGQHPDEVMNSDEVSKRSNGARNDSDPDRTPTISYQLVNQGDNQVEEIQISLDDSDTDTSVDSKTSFETVRRISPVSKEVTSESDTSCSGEPPEYTTNSAIGQESHQELSNETKREQIQQSQQTQQSLGLIESHQSVSIDDKFSNHYSIIEITEDNIDAICKTKSRDKNVVDADSDEEGPYATVCLIDGIITTLSNENNSSPTHQNNSSPTHQNNSSPTHPNNSSPTHQNNSSPIHQNNSNPTRQGDADSKTVAIDSMGELSDDVVEKSIKIIGIEHPEYYPNKDDHEDDYTYSTIIKSTKSKQAPIPYKDEDDKNQRLPHIDSDLSEDVCKLDVHQSIQPECHVDISIDQSDHQYTYSVESKSGKKTPAPKPPLHHDEIRLHSMGIPTPPMCRTKEFDYLHCVQVNRTDEKRNNDDKRGNERRDIQIPSNPHQENKRKTSKPSPQGSPLQRYKQKRAQSTPKSSQLQEYRQDSSKTIHGSSQQDKKQKPSKLSPNSSPPQQNKKEPTQLIPSTSQDITPEDFYLREKYFHYTETPNVLPATTKTLLIDSGAAIKAVQRPLSPDSNKEIFPWNEHTNGHMAKRPEKRTLFSNIDEHVVSLTSSTDLLANVVDLDDMSNGRDSTEHDDKRSEEKLTTNVAFL